MLFARNFEEYMNFTVSQWLQIIAIAVSIATPVSRWVWDARRQSKIIQPDQTTNDVIDKPIRHQKRKGRWSESLLPFCILGGQTLFGGELTNFDLGIMLFSVLAIIGSWSLWLGECLLLISHGQAAQSKLLSIMEDRQFKNMMEFHTISNQHPDTPE